MTETERVNRAIDTRERMINRYVQNTPDRDIQAAGIKELSLSLLDGCRDAGFSPDELHSVMQFLAVKAACPAIKWNRSAHG